MTTCDCDGYCRACRSIRERDRRRRIQRKRDEKVDWASLEPFASGDKHTVVELMVAHLDVVKVAEILGWSTSRVRNNLVELQRLAATRGWAPGSDMTKVVPSGYSVKGVSSYYGPEGELRGQWVKTQADSSHRIAALLDSLSKITEPLQGALDPIPVPITLSDSDLLNVIPIGDLHFGMLSWAKETGDDFDLRIAERDLLTGFDFLLSRAPKAKRALIIPLGDMAHADNRAGTTTSGTVIDTDSRWPKVLDALVRAHRYCIDRALQTHEFVDVILINGNHDWHTAIALGKVLAAIYEREPRIHIDTSPSTYRYYRHGECLLAATHGDGCKHAELPMIMASDRALDWGATCHRYWYTGHIHHESVKEYTGCTVESFRTLAAKDAWHAFKGYRSGRDLRLHTWHARGGKIHEDIVDIRTVQFLTKEE